jgi:hypothetical protein
MDSVPSSRPLSWAQGDSKDEKVIGVTEDTYSGSEYERFLTLEAAFEGSAKKKLLRKRGFLYLHIVHFSLLTGWVVDMRLLPTLSFLYLMCSLDKANAGNAKV